MSSTSSCDTAEPTGAVGGEVVSSLRRMTGSDVKPRCSLSGRESEWSLCASIASRRRRFGLGTSDEGLGDGWSRPGDMLAVMSRCLRGESDDHGRGLNSSTGFVVACPHAASDGSEPVTFQPTQLSQRGHILKTS